MEEMSDVYGKDQLVEVYDLEIMEPYSFWYMHLAAEWR